MRVGKRIALVLLAVSLLNAAVARAQDVDPTVYQPGDVFLSIGSGVVAVYRFDLNTGAYEPVNGLFSGPGLASFRTTGSAFDQQGNFYVTLFNNDAVSGPIVRFQRDFDALKGHEPVVFPSYGNSPESIAFDAAGNLYVGHKNKGTPVPPCFPPPPGVVLRGDVITKISPDGACLASYEVEHEGSRRPTVPPARPDDLSDPNGDSLDPQGADWLDLSSDQRTLYYTSAGRRIMRFDTVTHTQLPDFASLFTYDQANLQEGMGQLFALRLLPDGSVLVADNLNVKHLNAAGQVTRTYDLPGHDNWFSLNLAPLGTSFWSGDGRNGTIHRFDIATGALEASIATPFADTFFGVAVFNEITQGQAPIERCDTTVLALSPVTGSTCSLLTLTATLTCATQPVADKTILFTLNGAPVGSAVTNAAGLATLTDVAAPTTPGTSSGAASAQFVEDARYAGASGTADVVLTDGSTLVLAPVAGETCGQLQLSAKMMCGLQPVSGKPLSFFLNGTAVGQSVTGADGVASLANVPSPVTPGVFPGGAEVRFAGDAQYQARTVNAGLELLDGCPPPPCQPTLVVYPASGSICGKLMFSATLTCGTTPLSGRTLVFSFGGRVLGQAQTGADGVAALTSIAPPAGAQAGTFVDGLLVAFAGDSSNLAVSSASTLTLNTQGCVVAPPYPVCNNPDHQHPAGAHHDPKYPPAEYPKPKYPKDRYPRAEHPQAEHPKPQYPRNPYPRAEHPKPQPPKNPYPQVGHPKPQQPKDPYPRAEHPKPQPPKNPYPQAEHPKPQYPKAPQPQQPKVQYPTTPAGPSYPASRY